MSKPLAICIEDMDAKAKTRYLRCVALPGRQPGLRLDEAGSVLWKSEDGVSCELWVSADDRLILYRPGDETPVTLRRAGRSLDAPCGKPVVVIDQDQIDVGARSLRVHVHGDAPLVAAPSPLPARSRPLGRLARTVATAAVIGAVAAAGGCTDIDPPTIQVIEEPPVVASPETVGITVADAVQGEWIAFQAHDVGGERVWITGTLTIEGNSYTFTRSSEITGTAVQGELGFLFDTPNGEVAIDYEVQDDSDIGYVFGSTFATCVFSANSTVLGEFLIEADYDGSVYLYNSSSKDLPWRITKQFWSYTGL